MCEVGFVHELLLNLSLILLNFLSVVYVLLVSFLLSSAPLFEALVEGRLKGFLYLSYYVFITIALVSYRAVNI